MTPYRCRFIDRQGEPLPHDFLIDAADIEGAIERGLEALWTMPQHPGFEIRDADRIVHRYIRPRREF